MTDDADPRWECAICAQSAPLDEIDESEVLLDCCEKCLRDHDDVLSFAVRRLLDRHPGHVMCDEGDRRSLGDALIQIVLYIGDL